MTSAYVLGKALPGFAKEIEELLRKGNHPELADQVAGLQIHDRCRCGDDFCATLYMVPQPLRKWGPDCESFDIDAERGMIIVDVVNGKIACIETLDRNEIRRKLLKLLP